MAIDPFDGPIPGENYTSDTKNYPWHRPPDISDLDEAIEFAAKRIMHEDVLPNMITLMKMKLPLVRIADIFATNGIAKGKWTPDMAIMLAGPITHMLIILAKGYGIKNYNTGLDKKKKFTTIAFVEGMKEIDEKRMEAAKKGLPVALPDIHDQAEDAAVDQQKGGFMGMGAQSAQKTTPVESSVEMMANEANQTSELEE